MGSEAECTHTLSSLHQAGKMSTTPQAVRFLGSLNHLLYTCALSAAQLPGNPSSCSPPLQVGGATSNVLDQPKKKKTCLNSEGKPEQAWIHSIPLQTQLHKHSSSVLLQPRPQLPMAHGTSVSHDHGVLPMP